MKILFICTHNRCRSILAEAISNHLSDGRLQAKSAGSQPAGEVHPLSLKYLQEAGISTEGLCSQSWDDYENWQADAVITVCDSAAGEQCPLWLGQSRKVHWGLADPSSINGDEKEIAEAFNKTINILQERIQSLLEYDLDKLSADALENLLNQIGGNQ